MGALLDDAAGIHHQNTIAGQNGREAMRDHALRALELQLTRVIRRDAVAELQVVSLEPHRV